MSKTFPEHSNERCNVVGCLSDVTVFSEEGVVPLHNTSEAVKAYMHVSSISNCHGSWVMGHGSWCG